MAHSEYHRTEYDCCRKEKFDLCQAQHTNGFCPFYTPKPTGQEADLLEFCAVIGVKLTPWQSALLLAWCRGDPS